MRGNLYLLFPFIDNDLQGLLASNINFEIPQIKSLFRQILLGLDYLHSNNVVHRDIKGANILVKNSGEVQLADFGLARSLHPSGSNVNYTRKVVTLWYRAPELLYGQRNYSFSVDAWSTGCVFAEVLSRNNGKALFPGDCEKR